MDLFGDFSGRWRPSIVSSDLFASSDFGSAPVSIAPTNDSIVSADARDSFFDLLGDFN